MIDVLIKTSIYKLAADNLFNSNNERLNKQLFKFNILIINKLIDNLLKFAFSSY